MLQTSHIYLVKKHTIVTPLNNLSCPIAFTLGIFFNVCACIILYLPRVTQ